MDTIVVDPSPNRSTISATVVPSTDGTFIFTLTAKANGNGHGTPSIWSEIFIDGRSDKKTAEIPWQDGPNALQLTTAEPLKAGRDYAITGVSGNRNADATGMELQIRRAG